MTTASVSSHARDAGAGCLPNGRRPILPAGVSFPGLSSRCARETLATCRSFERGLSIPLTGLLKLAGYQTREGSDRSPCFVGRHGRNHGVIDESEVPQVVQGLAQNGLR